MLKISKLVDKPSKKYPDGKVIVYEPFLDENRNPIVVDKNDNGYCPVCRKIYRHISKRIVKKDDKYVLACVNCGRITKNDLVNIRSTFSAVNRKIGKEEIGYSIAEFIADDGKKHCISIQNMEREYYGSLKNKKMGSCLYERSYSIDIINHTLFYNESNKHFGSPKNWTNVGPVRDLADCRYEFEEDVKKTLCEVFINNGCLTEVEAVGLLRKNASIRQIISYVHFRNRYPIFYKDPFYSGFIKPYYGKPNDSHRKSAFLKEFVGMTKEEYFNSHVKDMPKSYKKAFIESPAKYAVVRRFMEKMNLNDNNSFIKLFNVAGKNGYNKDEIVRGIGEGFIDDWNRSETSTYLMLYVLFSTRKSMKMVYDARKAKSEAEFVNWVIDWNKDRKWALEDALKMYEEINLYDPSYLYFPNGKPLITIKRSKLHDEASIIAQKIRNVNIPLDFYKEERYQKLTFNFDGINIRFPVETDEVIDIGAKMHICVGSYRKRILDKSSVILVMTEKDRYVGCIEMDNTLKNVRQIKGVCNHTLNGRYAVCARQWVEKNNLNADIYDYKDMVFTEEKEEARPAFNAVPDMAEMFAFI